jgi:hypothetical protein
MADYYISTDDGRVHHISAVTAAPTIVVNDGVATTVFDGVYRDVFPYPNTGANLSTTFAFGPGWVAVPDWTGAAWDYPNPTIEDDVVSHTAPRYLEVKKSFWKFVTADGAYFFPIERVVGMSNTAPTY